MSGELPEGWTKTSLSEIVGGIAYGHTAPASEDRVGPKMLRITDLGPSGVDWQAVPFCKCDDVEKYAVKGGDILVARTGATTGKSYLVADLPEPTVYASYLIKLSALEELPPKFLATFMRSRDYWTQITEVSKGTAQPGANASILGRVELPLPPLNEQKRIVAKIDALTEKSREARQALDEVPALLDQLRQSILAAAFRGDLTKKWRERNPDVEPASVLLDRIRKERRRKWEEVELAKFQAKGKVPKDDQWKAKYKEPEPVDAEGLPELPEGWCWANFEAIAPLLSGFAFKSTDYKAAGTFLVRIGEIQPDGVKKRDGSRYLPRSYLSEHRRFMVEQGDLLIAMSGATTGKYGAYLLEEPALLNQRVGKFDIVSRSFTRPDYVRGLVASHQDAILEAAWGGAQPNISPKAIDALPIALAPRGEQEAIVRTVNAGFSAIFSTDEPSNSLDEQLNQLDSSILAKAFRGELVPQDPNDEPASVLLERIRAEREKTGGGKKRAPKKAPRK